MFHSDEGLPLSGLGLPNFLTLGRLLSIPGFYLFITRGHPSLALAAFLIGGLSDVADGMAARHLHASTRIGRIFDPLVDVLFNLGIVVGLTHAGYLPNWILVLVFIRYGILIVGGAWIYIARGPVAVRPDRPRSASITSMAAPAQPIRAACAARSYCRSVDSVCSRTCTRVDWRRYSLN
jgi:phosphatidylglycerophosphate synthase